jgi:hypothetical protein
MLPNPIFASRLHPQGIPPEQVVFSRRLTLQPQPIFVVGICRREAPHQRHVVGCDNHGGEYPAELLFLAIQIHGHCWFRHTIPYKSGWSYNGCATSPGLPPIEFALCSVVDFILPSIYYVQGQDLSGLWQGMSYSVHRDILYNYVWGRSNTMVLPDHRAEGCKCVFA